MSNIKKLSGAVLLDSPKGYGVLRNSKTGTNIGFTNAITIYGKKHLLNSLTSFLKDGSEYDNKLPKLIGLSIMFRRCGSHVTTVSDPPTKLDHKLTKGFFEHIYGVYGGNPNTVTKTTNKTSLSCFITGGTCGFKLEDITPATDTGGMWGGATVLSGNACSDPHPDNVWHDVSSSLGDAPKQGDVNQCLKDESTAPGFGFAKIAGISVLTSELGSYAGGPQIPTPAGSTSSGGNTIKVWRDPTFMELIHQQESLRTMGSASYQMPDHDEPHTAVSFGHYFPNKDHFEAINTAVEARDSVVPFRLGDSHLIGSCSTTPATFLTENTCTGTWTETHNIWEWKHCGIDTFAFTGFATHWYGANAGTGGDMDGSPFVNLDLTNQTADGLSYNGRKFDGSGDLQTTADADHKWYTPIARQAGNFNNPTTDHGYEFDGVTYWAWADHDSTMTQADVVAGTETLGGDGLLQDQVQNAEIEYDKLNSQAPVDQENFIDYNDTITTQYTLNFSQTSAYETALNASIDTAQNNNTTGELDTTIQSTNLAGKWAKDFGQDVDEIATASPYGWGTAENSAIRGIRLFDKSGRIMMAKTTGEVDQPIGYVSDDEISNNAVANYNNATGASFSVFTLTKATDVSKSVHVKDVTQIDNSHINDPSGAGSDYIIDNTSKRPRILVNTIRLFFNQLHVDDANTTIGVRKPHKLEVYAVGAGGTSAIVADDLIFTFILGSSEWEDNIAGDNANPFTQLENPDTTADGDILSMATADWTSGNHLDVTLKFVMV